MEREFVCNGLIINHRYENSVNMRSLGDVGLDLRNHPYSNYGGRNYTPRMNGHCD